MSLVSTKNLKRQARRVLERGLARAAPKWWSVSGQSLLVLAYHRVLPEDHPDVATEQAGMWVHPSTLRTHIRTLREHFELVHLDDWLTAAREGRTMPKACCALTFDDGWADNYRYAYPVLREESAPATIFLVSDYVATQRDFWPGRLVRLLRNAEAAGVNLTTDPALEFARHISTGPITTAQVDLDRLIFDAKVMTDEALNLAIGEAAAALGISSDPEQPIILDWSQIEEMSASGLVRFGSHGKSHLRLAPPLGEDTQKYEVRASRHALHERVSGYADVFCYPNGDSSSVAEGEVRRHYIGACVGDKGWNRPDDDPFRLRRILIHEDVAHDRDSFLARLSGIL